jgi:hypothetical protein
VGVFLAEGNDVGGRADPIGRHNRAPPSVNAAVRPISLACAIGRPRSSDTLCLPMLGNLDLGFD